MYLFGRYIIHTFKDTTEPNVWAVLSPLVSLPTAVKKKKEVKLGNIYRYYSFVRLLLLFT